MLLKLVNHHLKCSLLTNIVIPNCDSEIDEYAFCECSLLTNITVSKSIIKIGYSAFRGYSSLSNIIIPNSATKTAQNYMHLQAMLLQSAYPEERNPPFSIPSTSATTSASESRC